MRSISASAMLAAGWVRCRRAAAALRLPLAAACTNTSSWRGLTLSIKLLYRIYK
jgi:hypothetical protein